MKYLVDTNVCVDFLNGRYPSVLEHWRRVSPDDLWVSSVAIAELRYGADKSRRASRNHKNLDRFLEEVQCAMFDIDAAREFGRIRSGLERRGTPIGPYDTMIAAHALSLGCVLVTDNQREFERIEGLKLENWRLPVQR